MKAKRSSWQLKIISAASRCGWTLGELNQFLIQEYGVPLDGMADRLDCWMAWKDLCHLLDFQEWKRHRIRTEGRT